MNKSIKYKAAGFISLLSLFVFSFTGCNNQIEDETEELKYGYLKVEMNEEIKTVSDVRTFLPETINFVNGNKVSYCSFKLCGVWENKESIELKTWEYSSGKSAYKSMSNDSDIKARTGKWNFTLNAYYIENIVYTKTLENIEIGEGSNILDFGMMEENKETKGTLRIDCKNEEGSGIINDGVVKKITCEVYSVSDGTKAGEGSTSNYLTPAYVDLNPGDYRFIVKFYSETKNGALLGVYRSNAIISPGMTSEKALYLNRDFTLNECFKINYKNLNQTMFGETGYTVKDGCELAQYYNVDETITLLTSEVAKGSLIVADWYDNEELTGEPVKSWKPGEKTGEVTLYPKWCTTGDKLASVIKKLDSNSDSTIYVKGEVTDAQISEAVTAIKMLTDCTLSLNLRDTTITELPQKAFYNCTNLKEIVLPETVTSIETYAFYNCTSLTEVNIPASVTSIGLDSYNGCSNVTKLTIEDGETPLTITNNTKGSSKYGQFADMLKLKQLYIGRNLSYTTTTASTSPFNSMENTENTSLEVTVGSKVTVLNKNIFYGNKLLSKVTFEGNSSLTTIETQAFYNCSNLKEIVLPETVTSIETYAFYNCTSLTEVNIPASVTSIGQNAYRNCSNVTKLTIEDGTETLNVEWNVNTNSTTYGQFADMNLSGVYIGRNLSYTKTTPSCSPFNSMQSITSMTFGKNVTLLDENFTYGCINLKTLYFYGDAGSVTISSKGNEVIDMVFNYREL